ncbi:tRNA binding protein [Coccidioides immitis RMSCC 3703]|uniref:tRNA binding protein n=1 Tax=Coccidioides immitis RMSCC 3703 TaxID=454286 RepID=A0A0J8U4F8_COCIT|nr:tRNA binding protein [Coccidioides immitis RMSCC 3703]
MATASAPATSLLSLLYRSYPRVVPSNSTEPDLESISPKIFPTADYTDAEKAEINQWLSRSSELAQALKKGEIESVSTLLITVNTHLASRTTVLGAKPSVADVALYALLEKVLNPKKKIWETFQPGFTTTDSLEVAFDSSAVPQLNSGGETSTAPSTPSVGKLVTKSGGVCTVKSLKGAAVR